MSIEYIFKEVDVWLQKEKDLLSTSDSHSEKAYHRGAVAYLTQVGVLLKHHLTNKSSGRDETCPKGGEHKWGIDGAHSNEYCKKCFISRR